MAEQQPDPKRCSCGEILEPGTPHEWATRTRRAQGLPDHVEDPAVLDELARMILEDRPRRQG